MNDEVVAINVKLDENAIMPTRAHPNDAGLDLCSPIRTIVWPYGRSCIDTGVRVEIPDGYFGLLASKSGLMRDEGITSAGTIDEGYTGSIGAVLFNHGNKCVKVRKGQKITQLVILPCLTPELVVVDKLAQTERADGGFGSSGL